MYYKEAILLSGPIVGFAYFLYETSKIENVYFRKDSNNQKVFRPGGLMEFLVAPFSIKSEKARTVWAAYSGLTIKERIDFLKMNWLVTTTIGSATSLILYKLI